MRKAVSIILAVSVLAVMLAACEFNFLRSDEEMIRDRIQEFMDSYNNGDMEGVLDCFDAKTRNLTKAALNIGESVMGELIGFDISMSDMFGLGVGLMDEDILQLHDMEITIESDTKASVTATMILSSPMETYSTKVVLSMVKEDEDWFISNFTE